MGSLTNAIIEHNLSSIEIISLSDALNDDVFSDHKGNKLQWTMPNINTDLLEQYWKKTPEDFMKAPWGTDDLALLQNERISLHFFTPNCASFDMLLKTVLYERNPDLQSKFNLLAKSIALKMSAVDIIIIQDWYHDHAFKSDNDLTVDIIRKSVLNQNLPFYEIDLKS